MRKLILTISAAALVTGPATVAYADHHGGKRGSNPDTNGDGFVSLAEHNAQAGKMFERMDVNRDGVLNDADREAREAKRFARMDSDGNGQLSEAELKAARDARATKSAERKGPMAGRGSDQRRGGRGGAGRLLRMADADGDKSITRAEFEAAAGKRFAKMDANSDGSVSTEERKAAHKGMRARMMERRDSQQPE